MELDVCALVRWRRAPLCGAGARLMWGQCHPLFAFPSPVETHNVMTIQAAEEKLPMSSLGPTRPVYYWLHNCVYSSNSELTTREFFSGCAWLCSVVIPVGGFLLPSQNRKCGHAMKISWRCTGRVAFLQKEQKSFALKFAATTILTLNRIQYFLRWTLSAVRLYHPM
jgi:hypothetical protein